MEEDWSVSLLPAARNGNTHSGKNSRVRNQNVELRNLLSSIAELTGRLELGEVEKANFDVLVAGRCLDIYRSY